MTFMSIYIQDSQIPFSEMSLADAHVMKCAEEVNARIHKALMGVIKKSHIPIWLPRRIISWLARLRKIRLVYSRERLQIMIYRGEKLMDTVNYKSVIITKGSNAEN